MCYIKEVYEALNIKLIIVIQSFVDKRYACVISQKTDAITNSHLDQLHSF